MKVGIDTRFAVHKRRGIGNYTLRLVRHLAEIDRHNEYILYVDRDDQENILPRQNNFKIKKILPSNYMIWEQIILPRQAKKDSVDILHCTGNTSPIFLNRQIKLVSSILDVMYLKEFSILAQSSSLYQRLGRIYRKMVVPKTIKHVSKVITISNYSKYDIMEHLSTLKEKNIIVTYLACDESFRIIDRDTVQNKVRDKLRTTGGYILTMGGVDPRKNTELVIKTFIELKKVMKIKEQLVIVGIPDWKKTKFYKIAQESPCKEDIKFTDFLPVEDLVLLYNCATVFLYPSLYEGFGIPLLEAMACGVPLISSNTTSIPEIAGDAALLINPKNGKKLKNALLKLLSKENLRKLLIKRGLAQVKKFSWQKMAQETLDIYKLVYKEHN